MDREFLTFHLLNAAIPTLNPIHLLLGTFVARPEQFRKSENHNFLKLAIAALLFVDIVRISLSVQHGLDFNTVLLNLGVGFVEDLVTTTILTYYYDGLK